jgi:hypothetical protein
VDVTGAAIEALNVGGTASAQLSEWSKASLVTAFRVMKLLADEFLEAMSLGAIGDVIRCLSVFASQSTDVNISLTSVEMLWKVSDVALAMSHSSILLAPLETKGEAAPIVKMTDNTNSGFKIFRMMASCLEDLSLDPRPEVMKILERIIYFIATTNVEGNCALCRSIVIMI